MAIAVTMCKLFVTLVLGYMLNKKDILDDRTSKRISALIVNAVLPCLIISSVAGVQGDRGEVLTLFFTGLLFYCVFPFIGWIVARVLRAPMNLRGTYMCMVIFSNNSFMGFPVVSALFGTQAIFYTNIFHMAFNLMFFSLGMILIRRDADETGYDRETPLTTRDRIRVVRQVVNNGVIAAVLALIIYFAQIPLPGVVTETCSFIGDMCMPLSMLVIGSSIAGYPLKEIFARKRIYLISVVRLVLMPVLAYGAIQLFTNNQMLVKIVTITVGMPIAAVVAMGSAPFREQGKEASIAVVFTTLCSLITIPVMCLLLGT